MEIRELVTKWQEKLKIEHTLIYTESVTKKQIICTDEDCELVGVTVSHDGKIATIYHSREIFEDDIIHELLHIKHPSWTESQVNQKTAYLLKKRERG